ncbi:hypothetical protein CcaCcLH18_11319 [Colletotrichum camelliae]|nr:hypothetical protein CcaCcLH18_11319 [Colletotrichum camelliae]
MPKKKSAPIQSHRAWGYPPRNRRRKTRDSKLESRDDQDLMKLEDFEKDPTKDPGYIRLVITDADVTSELAAKMAAKLGGLKCIISDTAEAAEKLAHYEFIEDEIQGADREGGVWENRIFMSTLTTTAMEQVLSQLPDLLLGQHEEINLTYNNVLFRSLRFGVQSF